MFVHRNKFCKHFISLIIAITLLLVSIVFGYTVYVFFKLMYLCLFHFVGGGWVFGRTVFAQVLQAWCFAVCCACVLRMRVAHEQKLSKNQSVLLIKNRPRRNLAMLQRMMSALWKDLLERWTSLAGKILLLFNQQYCSISTL